MWGNIIQYQSRHIDILQKTHTGLRFWSNWHLQSSFSLTWNVLLISRYILPFVSISFFSQEIWGKCFEWFAWFCFIFLSLPVISGDETLQQCSPEISVWTFWRFCREPLLRLGTGKWERIVKFMSLGATRNINSFLRENHKSQNTYHQTQRLLTTALNFMLALLDGNPYNPIMQGSILGSFSPRGLPVFNKHHNYCKCCLFSLIVTIWGSQSQKFSKGATNM